MWRIISSITTLLCSRLGGTEQHGYLSLGVDAILSERVAIDAAEPLGIPVFPVLPYGVAPYFRAFPGTICLRVETYVRVIRDNSHSIADSGFKRVLLVNGHGGNVSSQSLALEWVADHPGIKSSSTSGMTAPSRQQKRVRLIP